MDVAPGEGTRQPTLILYRPLAIEAGAHPVATAAGTDGNSDVMAYTAFRVPFGLAQDKGKTATTYPTTRQTLEGLGITVEEKPFIEHGNIATSGGCLAAQYIVGLVIERKADKSWKDLVLKSIQLVGEGLSFSDATELERLYVAVPMANAVS